MKCPHCLNNFHDAPSQIPLGHDVDGEWCLIWQHCPACQKYIFSLRRRYARVGPMTRPQYSAEEEIPCYPASVSRIPLPAEVPAQYANDYKEACVTLALSPKASAALSRRCLQGILRDVEKVKPSTLSAEIQEVLDRQKLPSHIAESLDGIRNIGNFAAHPTKSKLSNEIIEVEAGEAEWNLDVLESLFDYYFVQPEIIKKKRAALNEKLKSAGKPEMK